MAAPRGFRTAGIFTVPVPGRVLGPFTAASGLYLQLIAGHSKVRVVPSAGQAVDIGLNDPVPIGRTGGEWVFPNGGVVNRLPAAPLSNEPPTLIEAPAYVLANGLQGPMVAKPAVIPPQYVGERVVQTSTSFTVEIRTSATCTVELLEFGRREGEP